MSSELKINGPLSSDYKQIYIDDQPTNLFLNKDGKIKTATIKQDVLGKEVEITGNSLIAPKNLQLKYDNDNRIDLTVESDGHLKITGTGSDDDFTLDFDGSIVLDSLNDSFEFKDNGTQRFAYKLNTFFVYGTGGSDYFAVLTAADGATTLATSDTGGTVGHLTISPDGSLILNPADGKYIAKNNGTEFSATDSAYAGMILGYTRLQGDLSTQGNFEIQNSITVEDDTHKVTFKTPPSENVEIEITCAINRSSTDATITAGLSDADASTGYNSIGVQFEYDYVGLGMSDDEADDEVVTAKWILGASELASVGSSNTFWIGFGTGGLTKSAWLTYGVRATHGICTHPFVIKATALPTTIYDGQ